MQNFIYCSKFLKKKTTEDTTHKPVPSTKQPQMSISKSLPIKSTAVSSSAQRSSALSKAAAFTSKYSANKARQSAATADTYDSDLDMSISLDEDVLSTVPADKRSLLVSKYF